MKLAGNLKLVMAVLLASTAFWVMAQRLKTAPRQSVNVEMQVALPLFVQVFMAAGDRYLAGNIAAIRAVIVDTFKMKPEEFATLAKVQRDVSWLNPGHEDNYYTAAAILPWQGEIDSAQDVLARATKARPFDYQPALFYAFNEFHFKGDAAAASAWLRAAAEHLPEGDNRLQMQNLAAIWMDKTQDIDVAIRIVEGMAKQAKRRDFQRYLEVRVNRLRALKFLRTASGFYQQRFGHAPATLQELIDQRIIDSLPQDPFGFGYWINDKGHVMLRNSPAREPKK
jgi:hypothetical protein